MIVLASIAVGAVMAAILFHIFFDDFADFADCLRLYFTPEIINAFRGEWHEGGWAYAKLLVYFGVCVGSGFLTFYSLTRHFGP
jgi:hypothetical protein